MASKSSKKKGWIDWKNSRPREILVKDLAAGGWLENKADLGPKAVWKYYVNEYPDIFGNGKVVYEQFRERLNGHRKQVKEKIEKALQPKEKTIGWNGSAAKEILLDDLCPPHGILYGRDKATARELWPHYQKIKHFEFVKYTQFRTQLNIHRKQLKGQLGLTLREKAALEKDRKLHPRPTVTNTGKLVFDLLPERNMLREDIANKKHVGRTPSQIQLLRPEYAKVDPREFSNRVFQYKRREKFINYVRHKRDVKRGFEPVREKDSLNPFDRPMPWATPTETNGPTDMEEDSNPMASNTPKTSNASEADIASQAFAAKANPFKDVVLCTASVATNNMRLSNKTNGPMDTALDNNFEASYTPDASHATNKMPPPAVSKHVLQHSAKVKLPDTSMATKKKPPSVPNESVKMKAMKKKPPPAEKISSSWGQKHDIPNNTTCDSEIKVTIRAIPEAQMPPSETTELANVSETMKTTKTGKKKTREKGSRASMTSCIETVAVAPEGNPTSGERTKKDVDESSGIPKSTKRQKIHREKSHKKSKHKRRRVDIQC